MATELTFTSEITVELVQSMGGDSTIAHAARVSTRGSQRESIEPEKVNGLIRYLMQMRHGTPFEHSALTFFVRAPIFVWREWHRHRIGHSYNEESARYKTLDPVFYVPPRDRPCIKVADWKPGRPKFLTLDEEAQLQEPAASPEACRAAADWKYNRQCERLRRCYAASYAAYLEGLADNFDPGLARDCLPVGIYSSCWVTVNPRSLMAFLSLRTHDPEAKAVSYPLYEIEVAARACERLFAEGWPVTHAAFVEFGRVAP